MVDKIINFLSNSNTSDKIALLALLTSIILPVVIQLWSNGREDKKENQQEQFQRETQDKLEKFQDFQKEFLVYKQTVGELQFKLQNRSDLIPYFHLNRSESRVFKNSNKFIVEIYLTNVGRGTATNIKTCESNKDSTGNPIYFDQSPSLAKNSHCFYNYFSENVAIPNESISFSLCEIEQQTQQLYFLIFKISFSDTLGREYEQEFKFGYDNYLVKGINQNSISYPPKLIKDIN